MSRSAAMCKRHPSRNRVRSHVPARGEPGFCLDAPLQPAFGEAPAPGSIQPTRPLLQRDRGSRRRRSRNELGQDFRRSSPWRAEPVGGRSRRRDRECGRVLRTMSAAGPPPAIRIDSSLRSTAWRAARNSVMPRGSSGQSKRLPPTLITVMFDRVMPGYLPRAGRFMIRGPDRRRTETARPRA